MPAVITIDDPFPLTDDEAGALIYELAIVAHTDTDTEVALSAQQLVGTLSRAAAGLGNGPSVQEPSALHALKKALRNAAFDGQLPAGLDSLRHGLTNE